tara:strand:- start:334 stop:801 length:468 start_codon:yes stop_codon:yes gene_type:complete
MKAIETKGEIKTFSKYPKNFKQGDKLHLILTDETAREIGFKDVITPEYNYLTEELSEIKLVGDVYTYDVIEKPIKETLSELKEQKLSQLKSMVGGQLSITDWYIIREADSGEVTPQSIKDARTALRTKSNNIEVEINALTTKKEVVLFDLPTFNV